MGGPVHSQLPCAVTLITHMLQNMFPVSTFYFSSVQYLKMTVQRSSYGAAEPGFSLPPPSVPSVHIMVHNSKRGSWLRMLPSLSVLLLSTPKTVGTALSALEEGQNKNVAKWKDR